MRHSVKRINAVFLFLLLLTPSFAYEQITGGNTPNLAQDIQEENKGILAGIASETATSIGAVFNPLTSSMTAFFTKINEKIDYMLLMLDMLIIVSLLIVSQIILLKIWKGLIGFILKMMILYKLLKTPQSNLADMIEILSNGKSQVSKNLRNHLKSNKNSNNFITKASLFLSYIL